MLDSITGAELSVLKIPSPDEHGVYRENAMMRVMRQTDIPSGYARRSLHTCPLTEGVVPEVSWILKQSNIPTSRLIALDLGESSRWRRDADRVNLAISDPTHLFTPELCARMA